MAQMSLIDYNLVLFRYIASPTEDDTQRYLKQPHSTRCGDTENLATNVIGCILARVARLAARHAHLGPGPVGAASVTTQNINFRCVALHRPLDVVDCQISDGYARCRSAGRAAIFIVLFNDNAVIGDSRQGDVFVSDASD